MTEKKTEFFEVHSLLRNLFRAFMDRACLLADDSIKLTHEQIVFMFSIIRKEDEVIQKDMAEYLKKDKSAIFRMIDTLEGKGMIRRVTDQNDRRKNCLMVTKQGMRVMDNHKQIAMEVIEQIHEGIDENDLRIFYKVVRQFNDNINKLGQLKNS